MCVGHSLRRHTGTSGAEYEGLIGWVLGLMDAIGHTFGRERTRRLVGRVPLMEVEDFDKAETFFARWGATAVLLGRCVPLVRSFISIPAGIERMKLWKFSLFTTIGSGVWNGLWIGLGFVFGPAIKPILEEWSGLRSNLVVGVVFLLLMWFVIARLLRLAKRRRAAAAEPGV